MMLNTGDKITRENAALLKPGDWVRNSNLGEEGPFVRPMPDGNGVEWRHPLDRPRGHWQAKLSPFNLMTVVALAREDDPGGLGLAEFKLRERYPVVGMGPWLQSLERMVEKEPTDFNPAKGSPATAMQMGLVIADRDAKAPDPVERRLAPSVISALLAAGRALDFCNRDSEGPVDEARAKIAAVLNPDNVPGWTRPPDLVEKDVIGREIDRFVPGIPADKREALIRWHLGVLAEAARTPIPEFSSGWATLTQALSGYKVEAPIHLGLLGAPDVIGLAKAILAAFDLPEIKGEDDLIRRMVEAHDREESAQKGEPSPWREDLGAVDDPEWVAERIAAMREAYDVAVAFFANPPKIPDFDDDQIEELRRAFGSGGGGQIITVPDIRR